MHTLPQLPYKNTALEPHISRETLEYHHGKHIQTYVDNLNNLIINTEFADLSLEEIILKSESGPIFNNAAQIHNHILYFGQFTSANQKLPSDELYRAIERDFGSIDLLKENFNKSALSNFGSGWTWLVKNNS